MKRIDLLALIIAAAFTLAVFFLLDDALAAVDNFVESLRAGR